MLKLAISCRNRLSRQVSIFRVVSQLVCFSGGKLKAEQQIKKLCAARPLNSLCGIRREHTGVSHLKVECNPRGLDAGNVNEVIDCPSAEYFFKDKYRLHEVSLLASRKDQVMRLLEILHTLPVLVEQAQKHIIELIINYYPHHHLPLANMDLALEEISKEFLASYQRKGEITAEILACALLNWKMEVDEHVMNLLHINVLNNAPTKIVNDSSTSTNIIPYFSLYTLAHLSQRVKPPIGCVSLIAHLEERAKYIMRGYLVTKTGTMSRTFYSLWMLSKLEAIKVLQTSKVCSTANLQRAKNISLVEVLGVDLSGEPESSPIREVWAKLGLDVKVTSVTRMDGMPGKSQLIKATNDGAEKEELMPMSGLATNDGRTTINPAFRKIIESRPVSAKMPLVMFPKQLKDDTFDFLLKLYRAGKKPLYIAIDVKGMQDERIMQTWKLKKFRKKLKTQLERSHDTFKNANLDFIQIVCSTKRLTHVEACGDQGIVHMASPASASAAGVAAVGAAEAAGAAAADDAAEAAGAGADDAAQTAGAGAVEAADRQKGAKKGEGKVASELPVANEVDWSVMDVEHFYSGDTIPSIILARPCARRFFGILFNTYKSLQFPFKEEWTLGRRQTKSECLTNCNFLCLTRPITGSRVVSEEAMTHVSFSREAEKQKNINSAIEIYFWDKKGAY